MWSSSYGCRVDRWKVGNGGVRQWIEKGDSMFQVGIGWSVRF